MIDLGLDSLTGDKGVFAQLTKLGDTLNAGVERAQGWDSLIAGPKPAPVAVPLPAPNGTLPDRALSHPVMSALTGTVGAVMVGGAALVFLVILAIRGR